ncbi:hypothetical protein D8X55_04920 [Malacoplasma penetrans]|uniref:P35 family lipoprotein n=1 Tax=Malacoplasma penetrans TaxID=28227 RepID=UPI001010F18B|nr:P35 family lipoprotein [Malacoplasma penetrans]RXY96026.1 hypothetical protein D8X55_04920 [Malacoplasma penetrans]
MTGAFGIVATVPVIVSACSSTSDNNTGGNGGTDQGGGSTQTEKVTPTLKDEVDLSGSLSKIFDTTSEASNRKTTATLISDDIKENPENYFTNGNDEKVKEAVKNANVTVNGNFSNSEWTKEGLLPFGEDGNWKDSTTTVTIEAANKLVYATSLDQINISSLNDLKTQLTKDNGLKNILEKSGASTIVEGTTLSIENRLGFTGGDLLHVNVKAKPTTGNETNYDLQIPVSDINLSVPSLSIEVTGDNIEASNKTTTKYDFNIGIDPVVNNYNQGSKPTAATDSDVKVNQVLQDLKFGTIDTQDNTKINLDNEALIKALGIYNVTFSAEGASINKKSTTTRATDTVFTVTLKATPTANKNYVWADNGNSEERDITFDVTLSIG